MRLMPGYLLSTCLHRQFHTLPGLLDSLDALQNPYPNALRAKQGGSLCHFYDGLWYENQLRIINDHRKVIVINVFKIKAIFITH